MFLQGVTMNKAIIDKAMKLRHHLHMYPELSEQEHETKRVLIEFLKENTSLEIVDRGEAQAFNCLPCGL